MNQPKILCFAGSKRAGSFNFALAGAMAKQLSLLDCDVTLLSLADYPLPLFDQDDENENGLPEAAVRLAEIMASHQGIFIASPEYNSSLTPLLKNTLDWVSRVPDLDPNPYQSPVFAIGAASPGGLGGMRGLPHLRQVLTAVGALVIPEQVSVGAAMKAFDDKGDLVDPRTSAILSATANRLYQMSRSVGS